MFVLPNTNQYSNCQSYLTQNGILVLWEGYPLFKEQSAGSTLAELYFRHQERFVHYINGFFAIVIIDPHCETIIATRDPAGTIPLYYTYDADGNICFATTIKEILPVRKQNSLNPRKLLDYLSFFWTLDNETFFKDIFLIPQGSFWKNGSITPYFEFPSHNAEKTSQEVLIEKLLDCLHKIPEENTGFHLSGGIDSSLLCALAGQIYKTPPPAFVAHFTNYPDYDETPYAQKVAEKYQIPLHPVTFLPENIPQYISSLVEIIEEPKCHPPVFPRYLIERFAADLGIKRMINGRGADELFTGYDWHQPEQLKNHKQRRTVFTLQERQNLLRHDFLTHIDYTPEDKYDDIFSKCPGDTTLEKILFLDWLTIMHNWLVLDYKISKNFNITALPIFLEKQIIQFANSIPVHIRMKNDLSKAYLKELASAYLPPEIINRKKVGFRTPFGEMLQEGLEEFTRDTLSPDTSEFWTIFEPITIQKEINQHFSGTKNRGWQIWALLLIRLWFKQFIDSQSP